MDAQEFINSQKDDNFYRHRTVVNRELSRIPLMGEELTGPEGLLRHQQKFFYETIKSKPVYRSITIDRKRIR